jgi:hypothetical protein
METLLNELYQLKEIEINVTLTQKQQIRYMKIIDILQANKIEIPFGVEY